MVKTQVLKQLPGARKSKRGGDKGNVTGGKTASRAIKKGGYVRVIEGEEVRKDDPVECFLSAGFGSTS